MSCEINSACSVKLLFWTKVPLTMIISLNYVTPKIEASGSGMRALSWVARDWTIGGILRYQSGALIQSPPSNNNLLLDLARGPTNNPALWGGGTTFYNRVPGVNPLMNNPNCGCFDPTTQLQLNPAAWTDAPLGQFGTAAPYYDGYRWQRQPSENMSFGRLFHVSRTNEAMTLQVRAEFFNIFNRTFLSPPSVGANFFGATSPASQTTYANGVNGALTSGYGFVNTIAGAGAQPRSGQLVARFTF